MRGRSVALSAIPGARLLYWYGPLFEDADFRSRYAARWRELRGDAWSTQAIHALVDGLADEIRAAAARNFERWPEVDPGADGWRVGQVERLKTWLAERAAWIDAELEGPD